MVRNARVKKNNKKNVSHSVFDSRARSLGLTTQQHQQSKKNKQTKKKKKKKKKVRICLLLSALSIKHQSIKKVEVNMATQLCYCFTSTVNSYGNVGTVS